MTKYVINWVEFPEQADTAATLFIQVDGVCRIRVTGYGSWNYTLAIAPETQWHDAHAQLIGLDGYSGGAEWWGVSLIWATPSTIGRLVVDALNNQ